MVRVCEPNYKKDVLEGAGIEVRDLAYEDGTFPPPNIVDEWFEVLKLKWVLKVESGDDGWLRKLFFRYSENPDGCVAVHCVAGLGRAPVMVALALIELGLKYEGAVELIREWVDNVTLKFNIVIDKKLFLENVVEPSTPSNFPT